MLTPLRVLLVEDSPADAELMLDELRQSGFDPTWTRVDTEQDFVQHLASPLAPPQLILSDYSLPAYDGMRALQFVQAQGLDIPFILVSGTIGEDFAVAALKGGAADYLLKDRMARLGPAVTAALDQQQLLADRRRAEQALNEKDKLFRALVENSADGIVLLNAENAVFL